MTKIQRFRSNGGMGGLSGGAMMDIFQGFFSGLFLCLTELIGAFAGRAMALPATLDERFGVWAPVVAGAAAALAVAIVMAIYLRGKHRSSRDILRHGIATIVVLGLLAFVASDIGHAALDYLGITPSKPALAFRMM